MLTRCGGSLLLLASLLITVSAGAQSLLVVNQADHDISVIDPAAQHEVARIAEDVVDVHGHEIAASADGRTAWVPLYGNAPVGKPGIDGHEMLVIDVPSRKIVRRIDFGHGVRPHLPVLDAAHNLLYVTTELDKSVTVLDARTGAILGTVPTGQAESHMLAISHDGRRGYTANVGPGSVSVLDLEKRRTVAVIPIVSPQSSGWGVQRISISRDDRLVFTSDETQPRLAVIDTATNQLAGWIALPGLGYGSAATLDGHWLLIAIPSKDKVAVIDIAARKVVRTIDVARNPQGVLVRPDGKIAYVSCAGSAAVDAIDLSTWKVQNEIKAGGFADGMAWAE